jgi:hypothetical protein
MKRALAACVLGIWLAGCASWLTHENLSRLRAAELAACFIAHATLPDSKAIAVACRVGPEFTAMIDSIVGEHRAGVALELHNAGTCRPALAGDASPRDAW